MFCKTKQNHFCSYMEDLLYSVKIRESYLMSYFTRHLQRLVKFWHHRKKLEVDSASKLQEQSGFTVSWKYCLNLCSLRRLKGASWEEVYKHLFETSSVWQVFKVGVSSVPWKVSCRKRLLRSKKDYQGQILVNYSCHGWTFLWVGECVLVKTPQRCFSWYLEFGCGP